MTHLSTAVPPAALLLSWPGRLGRALRLALLRSRRRANERRARRDLRALDDHLLRDMGLTRDGLGEAVRHGRTPRQWAAFASRLG